LLKFPRKSEKWNTSYILYRGMKQLSGYERMVYDAVVTEGRQVEYVAARFGVTVPQLLNTLAKCKMKGHDVPDFRRRCSLNSSRSTLAA